MLSVQEVGAEAGQTQDVTATESATGQGGGASARPQRAVLSGPRASTLGRPTPRRVMSVMGTEAQTRPPDSVGQHCGAAGSDR